MRKRTPNPDDVKLSPSVDRETWRELKDLAAEQNRSLNDLLNEWITEKLRQVRGGTDEGAKGGEWAHA